MTLAQVAAGNADADIAYIADKMLAFTTNAHVDVRVGWEMNGVEGYKWSAVGKEPDFNAAFRHTVGVMRSRPGGSRFRIAWNPNNAQSSGGVLVNPETMYPGNDVVDTIGCDIYQNTSYFNPNDYQGTFNYFTAASSYGFDWYVNFAASKGKPFIVPEWGANSDVFATSGVFQQLIDRIVAANPLYVGYWDTDSAFNGRLSLDQYPALSTVFKKAFGPVQITSSAAQSAPAGQAFTVPVATNHPAALTIVGGVNAAAFSIVNGSLTMASQTAGTRVVTIRATDKRGLYVEQTVTVTVTP
jgi:hypothetical protein